MTLTRNYNLKKPADVRELLRADTRLQMLLSMAYLHNECVSKIGVLADKVAVVADQVSREPHSEYRLNYLADLNRQLAGRKAYKEASKQRMRQLRSQLGIVFTWRMPGRVSGFKSSKASGGAGRITGFTQKGLFAFSDLFTQEALDLLTVNHIMFQEEERHESAV